MARTKHSLLVSITEGCLFAHSSSGERRIDRIGMRIPDDFVEVSASCIKIWDAIWRVVDGDYVDRRARSVLLGETDSC